MQFKENELVKWLYCPKGGYGYIFEIPAQIIKINKKTISIIVLKNDGSLKTLKVKPENLRKLNK